jgi:hypothetical protein
MKTILVLTLVCVTFGGRPVSAQEVARASQSGVVVMTEFVLKDGSRLHGTLERETADEITFRTPAGATVTVRRGDIVSMKEIEGRMEEGQFLRSDKHFTRLFFAPTGRSLPRGRVSFGMFGYMMPFIQVGVTDRFSVGGGTPFMFGFEESDRPFWITPKFQVIDRESTQMAVGALHMIASGESIGIAYAVGTRGRPDAAATFGFGYAYTDDGTGGAVVMAGGERRVRNNLKLISENYMWKGGQGLLSGGVRLIGDHFATDIALVAPIGMDYLIVFPVVNFVYVF